MVQDISFYWFDIKDDKIVSLHNDERKILTEDQAKELLADQVKLAMKYDGVNSEIQALYQEATMRGYKIQTELSKEATKNMKLLSRLDKRGKKREGRQKVYFSVKGCWRAILREGDFLTGLHERSFVFCKWYRIRRMVNTKVPMFEVLNLHTSQIKYVNVVGLTQLLAECTKQEACEYLKLRLNFRLASVEDITSRNLRILARQNIPQIVRDVYSVHCTLAVNRTQELDVIDTRSFYFSHSTRMIADILHVGVAVVSHALALLTALGFVQKIETPKLTDYDIACIKKYGKSIQYYRVKVVTRYKRNLSVWLNSGYQLKHVNRRILHELFGKGYTIQHTRETIQKVLDEQVTMAS